MTQPSLQTASPSKAHRPLSPHLQIYRPQITSAMSIMHRITGVALSVGSVLLVWWLWAAAYSPTCFETLQHFFQGWVGKTLLIGWTAAFYYHLGNGLRHLVWDTGRGFDLPSVTRSGLLVLVFVVAATVATWVALCMGVPA